MGAGFCLGCAAVAATPTREECAVPLRGYHILVSTHGVVNIAAYFLKDVQPSDPLRHDLKAGMN